MLTIPACAVMTRDYEGEKKLQDHMRSFITSEERAPGIHASALLDPLMAYWNHFYPEPLSDRLVNIFLVGKLLHSFVLTAAADGKLETVDLKSDEGSRESKELGIVYSVDHREGAMPVELKTTRSSYQPRLIFRSETNYRIADVDHYVEQLLIYMVAENQLSGGLWILHLNTKDETGATSPIPRCYTITVTPEGLAEVKKEIIQTAKKLSRAITMVNPRGLPICRPFKCGEKKCNHWERCQPEGRYGIANPKEWKA